VTPAEPVTAGQLATVVECRCGRTVVRRGQVGSWRCGWCKQKGRPIRKVRITEESWEDA
jgi:ribosomal protein L37AE/L43A